MIDDEALRIACERGTSGRAVISFTGVGQGLGSIQKEEFARSLAGGGTNDLYYVIDKRRSWYNDTHARIDGAFRDLAPARGAFTLGNSMGGFGALLFAPRLADCRAAIAFAPQFSVMKSIVPKETRWQEFISAIGTFEVETCLSEGPAAPRSRPTSFLFFGADDRRDRPHADLFRKALTGDAAIFSIAGCGHDVAAWLKGRSALQPLLEAIIEGEAGPGEVSALLHGRGIAHTLWRPGERAAPGRLLAALRVLASIFG